MLYLVISIHGVTLDVAKIAMCFIIYQTKHMHS